MSGSSQRSLAELVRADEHPDACPNGDTRCNGETDLRAGELCCFACYQDASESAKEAYDAANRGGGA